MNPIRIVEVGPRDGLQNESVSVSMDIKLAFIENLIDAGLQEIEVTSFVSPARVPQLADAETLWRRLPTGPQYSALVPNMRGLERALSVGVDRIAIFAAASETFSRKNLNASIAESLETFAQVIRAFREASAHGKVRGYVSTAFECPYEGRSDPAAPISVARRLFDLGVDEISFGDTIGVAGPSEVQELSKSIESAIGDHLEDRIAWHFHDTYGTANANVTEAIRLGYRIFDSSAGGLGGCPFAPGSGGNLATEDLVYLLERLGHPTGVDLRKLALASQPVLETLGRLPDSRVQRAILGQRNAVD